MNNPTEIIVSIKELLSQGNRAKARELNDTFWSQGDEIPEEQLYTYIDCLINLGEIERAGLLLEDKIQNVSEETVKYISLIIKYCFLSDKLMSLKFLSGYSNVYIQSPAIFDWVNKQSSQNNFNQCSYMINTAMEQIKPALCYIELTYDSGTIDCAFTTNLSFEENENITQMIVDKITNYITSTNQALIQNFTIGIESVFDDEL